MKRGHLFTFEGIDGCGKSTQANRLEKRLDDSGITTSLFREPGGTPISEKIREVILSLTNSEMSPETEALLLAASRSQLLMSTVIPELERGTVILCDRYVDSTLAYQGYGRGLPRGWLREINRLAVESALPAGTFLFDVPVNEALDRLADRQRDRIEDSGSEFLERVRDGFLTLAEQESDRYIVLDGTEKPELLEERIYAEVMQIIS